MSVGKFKYLFVPHQIFLQLLTVTNPNQREEQIHGPPIYFWTCESYISRINIIFRQKRSESVDYSMFK